MRHTCTALGIPRFNLLKQPVAVLNEDTVMVQGQQPELGAQFGKEGSQEAHLILTAFPYISALQCTSLHVCQLEGHDAIPSQTVLSEYTVWCDCCL